MFIKKIFLNINIYIIYRDINISICIDRYSTSHLNAFIIEIGLVILQCVARQYIENNHLSIFSYCSCSSS